MFQIEATAQCIRLLELLHVTFLCFRLKLQHSVSDQLHGLPISKDWSYNGRPCSPRVLFVFESNPLDVSVEDSELGSKSRSPVCAFFQYEPKQYFQSLIKTLVSCILICTQWKIESYLKFNFIHVCIIDFCTRRRNIFSACICRYFINFVYF